ncbi:MAG: glutamate synthase subunit alpha, partial [Lutibacter sp.]
GSAGQSFGAFGTHGLTFTIEGNTNDYLGKGLSGAKIIVKKPVKATFIAEENIIIGNVCLFGAVEGEAYINGIAGERFAVRNSGATAVVEGVGDHGCEYMTGGKVIVLGKTGRNFAAGMSGGIAYIYDPTNNFINGLCNTETIEFDPIETEDANELKTLIEKHVIYTNSNRGKNLLNNWKTSLSNFVKVMPIEYKRALKRLETEEPMIEELTA